MTTTTKDPAVPASVEALEKKLGPTGAKILLSFADSPFPSWRTTGGIARSTGLVEDEVRAYIESHPTFFEVAPIRPAGTRLYGPNRELYELVRLEAVET